MTTTSSTGPAAHGNTPASQTQGTHAGARAQGRTAAGTPGNADLFANLLLLLNAGSDLPADALVPTLDPNAEATDDASSTLTQDSTQNPLAGLLGWPGAPLPLMPATAAATTDPSSTGRLPLVGDATTATIGTGTTTITAAAPLADGLTPTAAPETLDPDTLAALARANAPAEAATASAAPVRITAWRSTAGLAPHAAGLSAAQAVSGTAAHASVSQTAFAQATLARTSGADAAAALAPQMRSTVQLDERFAQASTDNEPGGPSAIGGTSGTSARNEALPGAAGAGGASGGAGQEASADLSQGQSPASEDPGASDATAQVAADADDSASGGWGAQHLRHASVRVGEPGEQAIDIQLTMAGQEVRVEFRTDDAQTRAGLAQDGGASLGDLLQRSGIDLGGVSVGAQGQSAGQDQPARAPQAQHPPAAQRGREADAPASAAAQPARPRADGSRPLDLFV